MRRTALVALTCVFAFACTDVNPAFFIAGNIIPQEEDNLCALPTGGTLLTRGRYNVDFPGGYSVFPLYQNTGRTRNSDRSADPSGVHIRGAEVELQDAGGNPLSFGGLPNPFTVRTTTYVPSSSDGVSPGSQVGEIPVIPESYRPSLTPGATIIAAVKAFGETTGGIEVETDQWIWTIELCNGTCLFVCPGPDADELGGCTPGQDSTFLHPCGCGITSPGCAIAGM